MFSSLTHTFVRLAHRMSDWHTEKSEYHTEIKNKIMCAIQIFCVLLRFLSVHSDKSVCQSSTIQNNWPIQFFKPRSKLSVRLTRTQNVRNGDRSISRTRPIYAVLVGPNLYVHFRDIEPLSKAPNTYNYHLLYAEKFSLNY